MVTYPEKSITSLPKKRYSNSLGLVLEPHFLLDPKLSGYFLLTEPNATVLNLNKILAN